MSTSPEQYQALLEEYKNSTKMLLRRDRELSLANSKLQQLDRDKSEFVSIAAHQLRTPLTAISWSQQMLLDGDAGPLTDEQADLLQKSQQSIGRMTNLIEDLLNVDHLEYGQVVYERKNHNINLLVKSAVDRELALAKKKNITLTYLPADSQIPVCCDSQKIKESIENLINNALKYTPAGGTVKVSTQKRSGEIEIKIADNGIGIPEAQQSRLFKKFSRADNAKKIDPNGSGLGLFIVKRIIEDHGGNVTLTSTEGVGTTFSILLPITN